MTNKEFCAHIRSSDKKVQLLHEHLQGVSEITARFAAKIGIPNAGALIGLMHDFGKYSHNFQSYIKSATGVLDSDMDDDYVDFRSYKGKIDHSTAGAQWIWDKLYDYGKNREGELCAQILFLCIASHHSGLIDCLDLDGNNKFEVRKSKSNDKTNLSECMDNADFSIIENAMSFATKDLIMEMCKKIIEILKISQPELPVKGDSTVQEFYLGFFTRFLFSCLIDADRINSADFEFPEQAKHRSIDIPVWDIAIERLNQKLDDYLMDTSDIAQIRRSISDNCAKRAEDAQGVFTLSVPTGGGKTLSSLRFALLHARHHKLERIIYIIPYTSIIEQNAGEIRAIVDRDDELSWVLEHHSNIEPEIQTWQSKLVSENWDCPIVFTTMVQFLEAAFGSGTRGVRRLHNLANSVLIFDEIQTLPVNCIHLFCNALNFLIYFTNTTAVLCTATQPLLNMLKSPEKGQLKIPPENELAGNIEVINDLFNKLKRVNIYNKCKLHGWSCDEIRDLILSEFSQKLSCLVVVNTKNWAQKLYNACEIHVDRLSIFHLSTNQCSAHRKILLAAIRQRLKDRLPVLCISTQLIEAGVDISFAVVVRFMCGLDSIAQSAGRCNRNGELRGDEGHPVKGDVYIVNPNSEEIDLLENIKIGKEKCERVLSDNDISHDDLLSPNSIERYFNYYFYERADDMVFPCKDKTNNILNLLSANTGNNYAKKNGWRRINARWPLLMQSFMIAAEEFKVIDTPTHSVIVQYDDNGKDLVSKLCNAYTKDKKQYKNLLAEAQKFSVNVFPNVWKKLVEERAVIEIQNEGIYYLDERYYSEEFGLSFQPVTMMYELIV